MASVVDRNARPAPQVAGGGGKPPGDRGGGGRKNPPPDKPAPPKKRKRAAKHCDRCGQTGHTEEEHYMRTLADAVDALVRKRQRQEHSAPSGPSHNRVAPAAQERGDGQRRRRRGRHAPPHVRRQRAREALQRQQEGPQAQQQLQPRPAQQQQREVEQHVALSSQVLAGGVDSSLQPAQEPRPLPHVQAQGGQDLQGPPLQADDSPHLLPQSDDVIMADVWLIEGLNSEEVPAQSDTSDSEL
ncbi:hypothetical protein ATEIFO6365_0012025600 [Aspergillus terreus]|uniref:Uncharacterized protein n=1 Tax=Aspergillus terreus TaxID=33178 RepID=A0A5M3ZEF6_ASPTE|nr:hypothetical protein ATETN484_0013026600 [Aspergillus terreus]GFF20500.1 hypothetical protein ATEIFO6365_0012025600 [Aspergillus terreus]